MTLSVTAYAAVAAKLLATSGAEFDWPADLSGVYYPNGTDVGECQFLYAAHRECPPSAHDDLCLTATLKDGLGNTLSFAAINGIMIITDDDAPGSLKVGNATSQSFAPWLDSAAHYAVVPNQGGRFIWLDPNGGSTVAGGVTDTIGIQCSGSQSVGYTVVIWGK